MKANDAYRRERLIFCVEWWPEDFPIGRDPLKSYVVAGDFSEAAEHFSELLGDIKSVERIGYGVYVPPVPAAEERA